MDDYLKNLDEFYLEHYGRSKRDGAKFGSGRYPLGSGKGNDNFRSGKQKVEDLSKLHAESAANASNMIRTAANGVKKVYKYAVSAANKAREAFIRRQESKKLSAIRSGDPRAIKAYMSKMSDEEMSSALKRLEQNTMITRAISKRENGNSSQINTQNNQGGQNHQNQNNSGNGSSGGKLENLLESGRKYITDQVKETAKNEVKFVLGSLEKGQNPIEAIQIRNVKAEANRNKELLDSLNGLRDSQKAAREKKIDPDASKAVKNYVNNGGILYSTKKPQQNNSSNSSSKKSESSGSSMPNVQSLPRMVVDTKVNEIGHTGSNKYSMRDEFFSNFESTPSRVETVYENHKSVRLSQMNSVFSKLNSKKYIGHSDQNGEFFLMHYGVKGMRWRRKKVVLYIRI